MKIITFFPRCARTFRTIPIHTTATAPVSIKISFDATLGAPAQPSRVMLPIDVMSRQSDCRL